MIKYELDRPPDVMNLCHCSMCRKVTGAAYGVFAHTNLKHFYWLSGENRITRYESSPGEYRVFCSVCGSNVPSTNTESSHVCIPAGSFDDDPATKPRLQIFAASKAPWHDLSPEKPAFDEFEPDDFFD